MPLCSQESKRPNTFIKVKEEENLDPDSIESEYFDTLNKVTEEMKTDSDESDTKKENSAMNNDKDPNKDDVPNEVKAKDTENDDLYVKLGLLESPRMQYLKLK